MRGLPSWCQPPAHRAEDLPQPTVLLVPDPAHGQSLAKLLPSMQRTHCWKKLAAFLQQRKCPVPTSARQALSAYTCVLNLVVSSGKKCKCSDHTRVEKDIALAPTPVYKKQSSKVASSPRLPSYSLSDLSMIPQPH